MKCDEVPGVSGLIQDKNKRLKDYFWRLGSWVAVVRKRKSELHVSVCHTKPVEIFCEWLLTLSFWLHCRQLPFTTSWAHHPLCTSPLRLSKGHYCCSKLHRGRGRGRVKTVVTAFQMISYKWLWYQDAFHLPIFLPSWCVFHPRHSQNLSILAFLHFFIRSLNTPIFSTFFSVRQFFSYVLETIKLNCI